MIATIHTALHAVAFIIADDSSQPWYTLPSLANMLFTLVTIVVTSLATYLGTRPKQQADITVAGAEARKTDAETIILSGDKLLSYIEKFEIVKKESLGLEEQLAKMRLQLADCVESRADCTEFMEKLKIELDKTFTALEAALHSLNNKDDLLPELINMKSKLHTELGIK